MINKKNIYIFCVFILFIKVCFYNCLDINRLQVSQISHEGAHYSNYKSDKLVLIEVKNKVLFVAGMVFIIYSKFILSLYYEDISLILNNYIKIFLFDFRKKIFEIMSNKFFGTKYQWEALFFQY